MSGGKPAKPVVVEAVEDTPSTLPHTYVPREGVDYLSSVTVGKDPNLVPENVKKDVSIFGTVGTLESGGSELGEYVASISAPGGKLNGVTSTVTGSEYKSFLYQAGTQYSRGIIFSNMAVLDTTTSSNTLNQTENTYEDIPAGTYELWQNNAGSKYNPTWNNIIQQMGLTAPCDVRCQGFIVAGEYISTDNLADDLFEATVHVETTSATITLSAPASARGYNQFGDVEFVFVPIVIYKS